MKIELLDLKALSATSFAIVFYDLANPALNVGIVDPGAQTYSIRSTMAAPSFQIS